MPNPYGPTTNPGDERLRCCEFTARLPLNAPAQIQAREERVIRTKAGVEHVLEARGLMDGFIDLDLSDPATLATEVPLFDPATYLPTGQSTTIGALFVGVFSYIHGRRLIRDAAQ